MNDIEKKFAEYQNDLVLQQSDLSLQSISDMITSGAIDISPKYQRRERWTVEKDSELIESFLLNIPVPPIYLAEDEYGTYSVIDGKQRVTAINRFLRGEFKLKGLEKFTELEGYTFKRLPSALANALKIRPYLRVVTLLRQSNPDLKHEVFLRLNKAGVALNAQEIRNVAFRGKFNDLLFDLSANKYFKTQLKATKGSKTYSEMQDIQYVLRFFTVKKYWKTFPGNMDKAMDEFMFLNYKNDDAKLKKQKEDFETAISFCETIWGTDGFQKPDATSRALQGFYDIQMVCPMLLTDAERVRCLAKPKTVRASLIKKLTSDEAFMLAVTQFTSNPRNMYKRISEFTDILRNI